MLMKDKIKVFQNIIGYEFKDEQLLIQAVTHTSYSNERKINKMPDNERLEFLGDAVLELVVSEYLFSDEAKISEGRMSKQRASIVCEDTLSMCAKDINLGEFMLLGKGELLTGGKERASILSDAFEAVIGAIYLDGGFANAKEFIHDKVLSDVADKRLFFDSKTILQEMTQKNGQTLRYELVSESGPDHNKEFTVNVLIDDVPVAEGRGRTKKAAEQEAAYAARNLMAKSEV